LGRGADLLGLSGPVDGPELRDVLRGCRPGGGPLTDRPGLRRRHGWDLVFAAPKSVSLLALSDVEGAGPLRAAFRGAVADAFGALEDNAAWVRRAGTHTPARAVVAGAFEHVASDAGQPHLHAHVVLSNLGTNDEGGWSCLVGRELWRWREGLGPSFQLALRSRLGTAGFGFEWDLAPGGLGEIRGVPGPQLAVASARSLAARAGARSFGSPSAGAARMAQARSRTVPGDASGPGGQRGDLRPEQAASILAHARARAVLPSPPPAPGAVERALAERSSTFAQPDVLVALAETAPAGLSGREMSEFSRRWCQNSPPADSGRARSPAGTGTGARWTSPLARHLDRHVAQSATGARSAHLAEVSPALARLELGVLGLGGQTAEVGARLACSGEGISVVPPGPWLAQAASIDAARAVWQAAGMSVGVSSPSEMSEWRWRALTSLQPVGNDGLASGRPGRRVLVVDAADHLSPAALARLVDQAGPAGTKLVLVAGGTVPSSGASLARSFDGLVDDLAPYRLASLDPVRPPAQAAVSVPGLAVRGATTGSDAISHLVAEWRALATPGHPPPLMVAFGPPEAEALNRAARPAWLGTVRGPELALGPRSYAVGDEVLALRRIGTVPGATRGTVVAIDERSLTVGWRSASGGCPSSTLGPEHARSLGYGYATTVPYLRSFPPGPGPGQGTGGGAPLVVLGDPLQLGARSALAQAAWVTVAGPGAPALGPGGATARRRAAMAELATGWPDNEMLDRAGPRPPASGARRRWAEIITNCALERELGLSRHIGGRPTPGPAGLPGRSLSSPQEQSRAHDGAMRPLGL
jgi:conjugative relaxase-like TrwC/TraI family protein